ncbi:MAG TPA: ABC transporter permease [Chitinophaga sp.]|uniref:ABC transporter permease n=1 Tax=Chitinophaga sp. TaxID=1869181 RepID=UPI002C7021BF|nr:ABC transporter permease [Chitinophaga sp.]HVI48328.1 ABC transporter permease [Chitinophaga sp.]
MLFRYIHIAFRNLRRQRLFAFINIAGLAVSIMVCLIALMSARKNLSYDLFHPDIAHTWRITSKVQTPDGRKYHMASAPLALGEVLRSNYSMVREEVSIYAALSGEVMIGRKKMNIYAAYTEPSFFAVFGFRLKAGDPRTALSSPNSIVLSSDAALKFFGHNDPMGKVLHIPSRGDYTVTGVLEPAPGASHIDYEAFASLSSVPSLEQSKTLPERLHNWDIFQDAYTYVVLQPGVTKDGLEQALMAEVHRYDTGPVENRTKIEFAPQALNKITPSQELYNDIGDGAPWGKVITVLAVALTILLSACFNYTNLSIVRSLQRAREVGVRKVNGALRWQVFAQFIVESVVICLLSLVMALGLLVLLRSYPVLGIPVNNDMPLDGPMIGGFLLFSIATGIIAGIIPAWAISSFQPAKVLRNMVDIKLFGGLGLRKTLIVIQFSLSLITVIFFVTVYRQFQLKANMDMGFHRDGILNVPLAGADYQLMKDRLAQVKGVETITASSGTLGMPRETGFCHMKAENGKEALELGYYAADADFLKAMQLQLVAGEGFPASVTGGKEKYIILNEKAVGAMGIKTPADAIGRTVWLSDSTPVSITGVIRDFNYQPIEVSIRPMAIRFVPDEFRQLQLVTSGTHKEELVAVVRKAWEEMHPGEIFSSGWMDEELYSRNSGEDTVSVLGFLVFMITMIAVMGLLGIVSYTTFTRRKEIGIRKVMGATVANLVFMLSKNYLKLIIIAGCIALPLGFLGSSMFLQIFTYRVSIGVFTLLGSFLALLGVALLAIMSQTWKAAGINPAISLRND